jgi:tetratricopeptide (TPR) repeat protein
MAHTRSIEGWNLQQALLVTAACLAAGVAGGWMLRTWRSPEEIQAARAVTVAAPRAAAPAPDPARLKQMADADAAPLLVQLQANPQNPPLLTNLGNVYYDAQQYATAVDYYGRALAVQPADASVRTDMGTAYWYLGNADAALTAFHQALRDSPNNPNTLFNLGLVEWQGKKDGAAALAAWKQLLAAHPDYAGRAQVERMMAQVK